MLQSWFLAMVSLLLCLRPITVLANGNDSPPANSFTLNQLMAKKVGGTVYYSFSITNNKDQSLGYCQSQYNSTQTKEQQIDCGSPTVLGKIQQPDSQDPKDGFTVLMLWDTKAKQPSGKVSFPKGLAGFQNTGGNNGVSAWFKGVTNFNYGKW